MDASQTIGVGETETRGDEAAPVSALRGEAPIAQDIGHEGGEGVSDLRDAEARLAGGEGEAVAGEGGRDHGERIARIAPEARGVGEHGDDLVKLPDRSRPAVREQEGERGGSAPLRVNEVEIDARHRCGELGEGVQQRLVLSPVVVIAPVRAELLHVGEVGAEGPGGARRLVGEARAAEPLAEICEGRLGNVDAERRGRHGSVLSPSMLRAAGPARGQCTGDGGAGASAFPLHGPSHG